jgi:hypothetical protein
MNIPNWAQELILEASLYLQSKGIEGANNLPEVKWRKPTTGGIYIKKKRRDDSSGVCHSGHITICAGKDRVDCKLVILHELCHWVFPTGINKWGFMEHEGHTPKFWDTAWDLYRQFKLPIRYCKEREGNYMKGSILAYHRTRNCRNGVTTLVT